MLQSLFNNVVLGLCISFSICSLFQCHTVINGTIQSATNSSTDSLFSKPTENILSKRDEHIKYDITKSDNTTLPDLKTFSEPNSTALSFPHSVDSAVNVTGGLPAWMTAIKSGALERTGFVVLGFMLIIITFFLVRGIRLRHKRSKSRKYGIITSTDMEMEPLDKDDEDDEDATLFDAQQKYTLH